MYNNKVNYAGIIINGEEIPLMTELVSKVRQTLQYANGFYFDTEFCGPTVKEYFKKNHMQIISEVISKINGENIK